MAFYDDVDSRFNAVISFTPNPRYDFGIFAEGYHDAANKLAEECLSKNGFRDYEAYPIVFLYRHAFELSLKNIAYWSMRLCAFKDIDTLGAKLFHNHNLPQQAELATKLLLKLFPSDPDVLSLTKSMNAIAKEFHDIDSTSFSYRYPIDKDGNYSTKPHQIVNVQAVYKNMNTLLSDLAAVNFGLELETAQAQDLYELLNDFSVN